MLGEGWRSDIDALQVEIEITPFSLTDDKDTISNLFLANGGKPLCSQRESIENLGWSKDVDKTIEEIRQEGMYDVTEPSF